MKNFRYFFILLSFLLISACTSNIKPDFQWEDAIYNQHLIEIFDGVHNFLNYRYGKFSVIEMYRDDNDTALIFLHGRGLNPNEQNLIGPMREGLSELGYNTYSIQLPVLKKGAKYDEYTNIFYDSSERIHTTFEYVKKRHKHIIVIAHSCGVHMLMSYIEKNNPPNNVSSIVLIGAGAVDKGQELNSPYPYEKIDVPILDIYGEFDFNLVIQESNKRATRINEVNTKSKQIRIAGSDHYHTDNSNLVIEAVNTWLSFE